MTIPEETHILLVDDYEVVREALHLSLEALGYVVHSAANGHQALQLFQVHPIDLAVLDIDLPEMDGYTLCAELRKQRVVPVIFISAAQRSNEQQQALSLEAAAFLSKPFLLSDLDKSIQRALQATSSLSSC